MFTHTLRSVHDVRMRVSIMFDRYHTLELSEIKKFPGKRKRIPSILLGNLNRNTVMSIDLFR